MLSDRAKPRARPPVPAADAGFDASVFAAGRAMRPVSPLRWSGGLAEQVVRAADAALLLAAAGLAGLAVPAPPVLPTEFHQVAAAAVLAAMVAAALFRMGSYTLHRFGQLIRPAFDALAAVGATVAAVEALLVLTGEATLADQRWLFTWAALAAGGIAAVRQLERLLVRRGLRTGTLRRKVVLIGATPMAERLVGRLVEEDRFQPSALMGIYDDRSPTRRPASVAGIPVEGDIDALCAYAADHPVDLIVIALPWHRAMDILGVIQQVQWVSADVMIPMQDGVFNPRTASVSAVAGMAALQVARQPLRGARGLLKLAEDYAVASVAVALLSPLMLFCALAVKLEGGGPVFFRQTRVGFNKRPFSIIKFRTMTVDPSDRGIVGTAKHNPRITRVGAVLRRLSLDEVPQLFNVLRGEMSVVGPRPHVPGMLVGDEEYTEAVAEYAARHRIKPGITGLAQVRGMRGGIHSVGKARRGVELDMQYVDNWSLGLDIRIMARTVLVGMFGAKVF